MCAQHAHAAGNFTNSPYTEPIPDYGSCDVVVTQTNYTTTLSKTSLNDPTNFVFCFQPGDYRSVGELLLTTSGTQQRRRFLRFDADDGMRSALQRSQRALVESVRVRSSWWVVQGLTIQPHSGQTAWFATIYGGDHVILDGNVIDGVEHVPALGSQDGVVVGGYNGDPATYNSVQGNVVRRGNQTFQDHDYEGIIVLWGNTAGENNDFNKILDNEIYDWGSGIEVSSHMTNCGEPGKPRGTLIDGNDVYITGAKRIDCNTGAHDPGGECSCSEDGIALKIDGGSSASLWTRVTNNRVWGFRPTSPTHRCGGSGANGQGIGADICGKHVIAADNVIQDATQGMIINSDWIVAGNLFNEIRISNGNKWGSLALFPIPGATNIDIQFNTVVGVDSAYEDQSINTETRCNAVIDNFGLKGGQDTAPASGNNTRFNYLYDASPVNFNGPTNYQYVTTAQSRNADYCYWRKRWTTPEYVCIPDGSTTAASPHVAAAGNCSANVTDVFGVGPFLWPTTQPCSDGVDDDGDGRIDYPDDPGCASATAPTEDAVCQNGIDDDGDGRIDFDGGASWNGGQAVASPDPSCISSAWPHESGAACGLGTELVGVLWLLQRARSWKARASQRTSS